MRPEPLPNRTPGPNGTARRPATGPPRRAGPLALLVLAGLLTLSLVSVGAPARAEPAPTAFHPTAAATPPPNATWAWGGATNLSFAEQYLGAYRSSLNLTAGNLSMNGAYLALNESARIGYAAYAVLTATTTSATGRSIELTAVQARELDLRLAASGSFPVAGSYGPNDTVPLANTSFGLAAREVQVDAYAAFLNLSYNSSGTVGLLDEHLIAYHGVNVSLAAQNFPNVTGGPNGTQTLTYRSGSIRAIGYVAEEINVTFSPALTILELPLAVGASWNATSTVNLTGRAAYAEQISYAANGATASAAQGSTVAVHENRTVALHFEVTGTTTVRFPDGSTETGYVVSSSEGAQSSTYTLWDGLVVLPGTAPTATGGVQPSVSARPASDPLSPSAAPPTRAVVAPSHDLPVTAEAEPSSGAVVTGAPMSPADARASIGAVGAPQPPTPTDFGRTNGLLGPVLAVSAITAIAGVGIGFLAARKRYTHEGA